MNFEYRGFNIECATTIGGDGFIGTATIWQASGGGEDGKAVTSGLLKSFPTRLQAIDYARVWAEIWCDGQFTPTWSAQSATVPLKKPKTTSRKPLGGERR